MIAAPISPEQRFRLSLIPWETYVLYSDGLGSGNVRVTFDHGEMEIRTLSSEHENWKKLLARLVEALGLALAIDIKSFGSMTCRKKEMMQGLEPDECYWIANESLVRGRRRIDLETVPPPDLALEVEVSRSSLDRMSIYSGLKIPEVWRWDGETLTVHLLSSRASYRVSKRSKAFPFLPIDAFSNFLTRSDISETKLMQEFLAWIEANRAKWKK